MDLERFLIISMENRGGRCIGDELETRSREAITDLYFVLARAIAITCNGETRSCRVDSVEMQSGRHETPFGTSAR
jgi:hypothetical protein